MKIKRLELADCGVAEWVTNLVGNVTYMVILANIENEPNKVIEKVV